MVRVFLPDDFMLLRFSILMMITTLTLCGCRNGNNYNRHANVRNDELRILEDHNFELLDRIEQLKVQLESCQRANDSLRRDVSGNNNTSHRATPENPMDREPTDGNDNNSFDPEDLEPPKVKLGNESDKPASIFLHEQKDFNNNKTAKRSNIKKTTLQQTLETTLPTDHIKSTSKNKTVSRIQINNFLTGGHNTDGKPGDEGVLVVFQPRNQQQELVEASGNVTIELRGTLQIASAAAIAKWNFNPQEVSDHYRKTLRSRSLEFDLPWPSQPPQVKHLNLIVTFTTLTGKTFTARKRIAIERKNAKPPRWAKSKQQSRIKKTDEPVPIVVPETSSDKKETQPQVVNQPQKNTAPMVKQQQQTGRGDWKPFRD